jgi:hypothetical protein
MCVLTIVAAPFESLGYLEEERSLFPLFGLLFVQVYFRLTGELEFLQHLPDPFHIGFASPKELDLRAQEAGSGMGVMEITFAEANAARFKKLKLNPQPLLRRTTQDLLLLLITPIHGLDQLSRNIFSERKRIIAAQCNTIGAELVHNKIQHVLVVYE